MRTETELYEQAMDDVLAGRTFEHPCGYGHIECATTPRGACSSEQVARRYGELLDAEASKPDTVTVELTLAEVNAALAALPRDVNDDAAYSARLKLWDAIG